MGGVRGGRVCGGSEGWEGVGGVRGGRVCGGSEGVEGSEGWGMWRGEGWEDVWRGVRGGRVCGGE